MRPTRRHVLGTGLACLLAPPVARAAERPRRLARRRTRHGVLEVVELPDGQRRLLEDGQVHSAYHPGDPLALPFDYLQLLAVGLRATAPVSGRVLVVGLGGGTLCRWIGHTLPGLERVAVEHARPVHRLARRFFDLDPGIEVHIDDGRRYVEAHDDFDVIVLDASSEDYVPPHLATVEFFAQCRAPVVLMNSWHGAPRADDEWTTWCAAFEPSHMLRHPHPSQDNRVLLGGPGVPQTLDARIADAAAAQATEVTAERPVPRGVIVRDP